MKRVIYSFILFFIGNVVVLANSYDLIDMDIYIDSNGDAHIKENITYSSSSNTEIYHFYVDMGNSTITNFTVKDSTGRDYTYINPWNVNGSLADKSYKYGYNYVSDGVELCLGISHYGKYTYYLSYTITDFVKNLTDSQLVYWQLIPPSNEKRLKYDITISADQSFADNLDVWGFGDYGAYAYVDNGYITLASDDSLASDEYVTVLVKFPSNYFNADDNLNHDFNYYLEMAQEGSTAYSEKTSLISKIIVVIVQIIFWGTIVYLIYISARSAKPFGSRVGNKKIEKDSPYFRDLPCDKDIKKCYFIGSEYNAVNKDTNLFGAILLKWLKSGNIEIIKIEKNGLFKKDENRIKLVAEVDDPLENELYKYMYKASRDGILESKEFEKWCKNNYYKIYNWFIKIIDAEIKYYLDKGIIINNPKKVSLKKYVATPAFDEEGKKVVGLKRYLNDFGSIKEKKPIEVKLWQEYLMFAQIFGIADKVAKEFKELYPEYLENFEDQYSDILILNTFSYHSVGQISKARHDAAARNYSAGGGGFSAGGGGGGSFGGGGSMGSR